MAVPLQIRQHRQAVRITSIFLIAVSVSAFLPSRERSLIMVDATRRSEPAETALFAQPFAINSQFADGSTAGPRLLAGSALPVPKRFFNGRNPNGGLGSLPDNAPLVVLGSNTTVPTTGEAVPSPSPQSSPNPQSSPDPVSSNGGASGPAGFGNLPGSSSGGGSIGSGSTGSTDGGGLGLVPEPGIWLMMILGFGTVGSALRRSVLRSRDSVKSLSATVAVSQA